MQTEMEGRTFPRAGPRLVSYDNPGRFNESPGKDEWDIGLAARDLAPRHLQICAGRHWASGGTQASRDASALFGALVGGRWNMAPKVHPVVEDAHDFDRAVRRGPVHQEMASAAARPRNVECAKARHDLVPSARARNMGTFGKLANRRHKDVAIGARLSRAKVFSGPSDDVGKVDFRSSAETNAPSPLGHRGFIRRFGR